MHASYNENIRYAKNYLFYISFHLTFFFFYKDLLMVSYLSNLVKTQLGLNEKLALL